MAGYIWKEEKIDQKQLSLSHAFKKLDQNGNGRIDVDEFKDLMMNKGECLSEKEFDEIMELVDKNNNGQISYMGIYYIGLG